jgi:hypothetical protein
MSTINISLAICRPSKPQQIGFFLYNASKQQAVNITLYNSSILDGKHEQLPFH